MNFKTYLPLGVALVAIIGAAAQQGIMSERWRDFPELQIYADQLD